MYIRINVYRHIYVYIYIYIIHVIRKTMCPPGYYRAIVAITGREYCFHDYMYIMAILPLSDVSTLYVMDMDHFIYIYTYIYIYIYYMYIYIICIYICMYVYVYI